MSLLHDCSIRIHLHLETPAQRQPNRFAGKTASEQVIIKPGELFCIHWRGKGPELSFESLLKWFQFSFGRVGFLQLFSNELGVQAAGSKFLFNSGPTLGFALKAGLDKALAKLPIVKIPGGFQPGDDLVDGAGVGTRLKKLPFQFTSCEGTTRECFQRASVELVQRRSAGRPYL